MEKPFDIVAFLLGQVKTQFGFLSEFGFHLTEQDTVATPTLAEIILSARRVALIVSFDWREQTTSLYVAKVRDGRITHRGESGYYSDFSAYLRKYCKFRGSISDGITFKQLQTLTLQERIGRDIRVYAKALQAYAPRLVNDEEDFDYPQKI